MCFLSLETNLLSVEYFLAWMRLAKEIQLRHGAPLVSLTVVDKRYCAVRNALPTSQSGASQPAEAKTDASGTADAAANAATNQSTAASASSNDAAATASATMSSTTTETESARGESKERDKDVKSEHDRDYDTLDSVVDDHEHQVVIASEEQVKIFKLPHLIPKNKVRITATQGVTLRRALIARFSAAPSTTTSTCVHFSLSFAPAFFLRHISLDSFFVFILPRHN